MNVELLAPAGDFQTALAAFGEGADAVYCGLADFSARAFATNLSFEELESLVAYARKNGRRVYVTFNTLLDEDQVDGAIETLARLEAAGPDGVIVQDLGVARLVHDHFPRLGLHASTQLVAHNLEGVLALGELGFRRIVLARELSADEVASIAKRCGGIELEAFVHGALCYSISGLCLFGAMEKGRSGNRGRCPYCCRLPYADAEGRKTLPFSMKDLRLGGDVKKLVDAGVVSLKIEGRMKSPLYVASVTRYYRQILDGTPQRVSEQDLETVFSRRTTELYLNGRAAQDAIDPESPGHLGAEVGVVKKVTRDREGRAWLRFHTCRGLEKHDGLQFEATTGEGRRLGMGVVEMRQAISRRAVFEVNAGVDVEVLVPEEVERALRPGMKIYCSMSNAVKRMFPPPSFRPSDYPAGREIDVAVRLGRGGVSAAARTSLLGGAVEVSVPARLEAAKSPGKTAQGVRKAFERLGGTGYRLGALRTEDPEGLFAPMSVLNDVRRDLVEALDERCEMALRAKVETAKGEAIPPPPAPAGLRRRVKIRAGQALPPGEWDEVVVAVAAEAQSPAPASVPPPSVRLALPVYTPEPSFNRLRTAVKRLLRAGYAKWEASDLATLRMLKALGVEDVTADWTLYAFNARSLATLAGLGARRFVASPENDRANLQYLAESGYAVEFLTQQSTPLFISLTKPATMTPDESLRVFERDGLWVTTKAVPRTFDAPHGASTRLDLSWDPS